VIKAIVTDVDGTLYRQDYVRLRMAAMLLRYSVTDPPGAWRTMRALRAYRHAQEVLRASNEAGAAHLQAAWAASRTGYDENFIRACVHRWMEMAPLEALRLARFEGLEEFCRWTASTGLRLAALSDYDPHEKLRALGIESYFELVVCSSDPEIGVFKPNPRGLLLAIERFGVQPAEAVYIGDRLEVDGAAALAAGVSAIVLTSRRVRCPEGVQALRSWSEIQGKIANSVDTRDADC
jgi:putative hydrolase of the HAD superfamily